MNPDAYQYKRLKGVQDDLMIPWLELYEQAFPARERILVADILSLWRNPTSLQHEYLLGVLDPEKNFAGLVWYSTRPEYGLALLWYLAVQPHLRSRGVGAQIYQYVVSQLNPREYSALIYEVEIPEEAETPEQADFARSRIEFYRRNGGMLLNGIHYEREVGSHAAPIPMHLMVHPLSAITAEQAFALCRSVLGDAISQTGVLTLD